MREIKFRAWDKVSKCMRDNAQGQMTFLLMHEDDFNLMQFTGLHDKNGKEIYEGDIISENAATEFGSYERDRKLEVYFNSNTGAFRAHDKIDADHDWSIGSNCEVIGNVYENPQLLSNQQAA